MPDTNLILHVKGTESETTVLPKHAVRSGVSEGKITHSQLIWVPNENTWKQVKELPDLLPGERLILHVKGTEAETRELPKTEVKAAVSEGTITQSQLIWVAEEQTWKQVREIPDLMPGETLILHVKGTEAGTQELPKRAVQAGVSKGQITHSQLIWIPNEHTWKPVRELPELLPGERFILHVKGTEAQTTELPRRAIKTAISKGEMTHSQLIWSPNEHAWKQVRELPDLLPSQKLAPAPSRETLRATPRIADDIIPESPNGPVARAVAASGDIPKVRVAVAADQAPKVVARADGSAAPQVRVAGSPPRVIPKVAAATPRVAEATPVAAASPAVATPVVAAHVPVAVAVASVPQVKVATVAPPQVLEATPAAEATPEVATPVVATPVVAAHVPVALASVPQVKVATVAPPQIAEAKPVVAAQASLAPTQATVPQVKAVAAKDATVPQARAATPSASAAPAAKVKAATPSRIAAARVSPAPKAGGAAPVSYKVKENDEAHPLKWVCIGLGAVILLLLLGNFALVNHPLNSKLAETHYSDVTVFSHLGAFVQPSVLVVHIRPSDAVTPETLVPFLVALAHSTPDSPFTGEPYARVAITSGWTAQYSFSGYSWKELGDMDTATDEQRKMDIMSRMADAAGSPIQPQSTLNDQARQAQSDVIWAAFVNHFTSK